MFGQQLSEILVEVEDALWDFQIHRGGKPDFTEKGFRAAIKIFMDVLLDKMWELGEADNIQQSDREAMGRKAGEDIRRLVKTYTGIDTLTLYK